MLERNLRAHGKTSHVWWRRSLFKFVINPKSFGQTVENMFYVSFLIKEGGVGIKHIHIIARVSCKYSPNITAGTRNSSDIIPVDLHRFPRASVPRPSWLWILPRPMSPTAHIAEARGLFCADGQAMNRGRCREGIKKDGAGVVSKDKVIGPWSISVVLVESVVYQRALACEALPRVSVASRVRFSPVPIARPCCPYCQPAQMCCSPYCHQPSGVCSCAECHK